MKERKFVAIAFIIFLALALLVQSETTQAEEKKIVVIEKSTVAGENTNHEDNAQNLPEGATDVEAGSLDEAVTKILNELGEGDCIKELHFRGHGSPGNQSVGDGVKHRAGARIDGHAAEWGATLNRLKNKFCEGATIYLWGCNMGSCDDGAAKLKELADHLGVTVKAPTNCVTAGEQNNYAGPMQTATPNAPQPECIEAEEEKAKKKPEAEEQGSLRLTSEEYFVYENVHSIYITVIREYGSDGEVTVDVFTTDGTATAPDDYTATLETLIWPDGDMTPKTCYIEINDDAVAEGNEVFYLSLTNVTGGADLGTPNEAQVTIVDNEVVPEPPTLSQWVLIVLALSVAGFFIWQLKRRRKTVIS